MKIYNFIFLALTTLAYAADNSSFSETFNYSAEYFFAPGTVQQKSVHLALKKEIEFEYRDLVNQEDLNNIMTHKLKSSVLVYTQEQIAQLVEQAQEAVIPEVKKQAAQEAKKQAAKNSEDYNEVYKRIVLKLFKEKFSQKLTELAKNLDPAEIVNCNDVSYKMVKHLLGHMVQVRSKKARVFLKRPALDSLLLARNLNKVEIGLGKNNQASFQCSQTINSQDGFQEKCGLLKIRYAPQVAQEGLFKGQTAVIFDSNRCAAYSKYMDLAQCKLLVHINGCGLSETFKSLEDKNSLADELEAIMVGDLKNFEGGFISAPENANPPKTFEDLNHKSSSKTAL